MTAVTVVDYGAGNLRSLRAAFERLGVGVEITTEPGIAERSRMLVVPGVGAAGPAMERLRVDRPGGSHPAAADRGAHVLGICLGLQLLFDRSEEGDTGCLGLLPGDVRRIDWAETVPHMGWNDVAPADPGALDGTLPAVCYFAHAYVAQPADAADVIATTELDGTRSHPPSAADAWRRCSFTRSGAAPPAARSWRRSSGGAAMLRRRIIPCLDVRRGRLVKGVRFRDLRDCGDPVDAAARYAETGADEIVWLNISAGEEAWAELLHAVERAARRSTCRCASAGASTGSSGPTTCSSQVPTR